MDNIYTAPDDEAQSNASLEDSVTEPGTSPYFGPAVLSSTLPSSSLNIGRDTPEIIPSTQSDELDLADCTLEASTHLLHCTQTSETHYGKDKLKDLPLEGLSYESLKDECQRLRHLYEEAEGRRHHLVALNMQSARKCNNLLITNRQLKKEQQRVRQRLRDMIRYTKTIGQGLFERGKLEDMESEVDE
ncbi:hypothetical protein H0H93_006630 [Arthromyces matolae]|nr:hypothetical protein H0H93_006630 [Arthromyces matolae]